MYNDENGVTQTAGDGECGEETVTAEETEEEAEEPAEEAVAEEAVAEEEAPVTEEVVAEAVEVEPDGTTGTVKYLDETGAEKTAGNVTEITEGGSCGASCYVLTGEKELGQITFTGETHLILADGADVTVSDGIRLNNGSASLTIYAQSTGGSMGCLTAIGAAGNSTDKYGNTGIGSGFNGSCGDITVEAGYVRAASSSADKIGVGYGVSCGNIDFGSCKHWDGGDGWYYVTSHDLFPALTPTCTEAGHKEYFQSVSDNLYYSALPFSEATRIGDANALADWLAVGDGYLSPLGHTDKNRDDLCDRCGIPYFHYYDYDPATGQMTENHHMATVIEAPVSELTEGWYVAKGKVEAADGIAVNGDVHLILADGATLTVKKGILLSEGAALTIYSQSFESSMGTLTVTDVEDYCAGIGSGFDNDCEAVTINGGNLDVTGGECGAGIGCGAGTDCKNVTINGGNVTATGGYSGAGIGGGYGKNCNSKLVTINGGTIWVVGGDRVETVPKVLRASAAASTLTAARCVPTAATLMFLAAVARPEHLVSMIWRPEFTSEILWQRIRSKTASRSMK